MQLNTEFIIFCLCTTKNYCLCENEVTCVGMLKQDEMMVTFIEA